MKICGKADVDAASGIFPTNFRERVDERVLGVVRRTGRGHYEYMREITSWVVKQRVRMRIHENEDSLCVSMLSQDNSCHGCKVNRQLELKLTIGRVMPARGTAWWGRVPLSQNTIRLESMAELSLTQTSEQSSKLFVDTAGFPLLVYLDVNPEIPARPRLIRLLRVRAIILIMCLID